MNAKLLLLLLAFTSPLLGVPSQREGVALQEMRILCEDFAQKIHHQKVEIELLQEKIQSLESSIAHFQSDNGKAERELSKDRLTSLERRLSTLEKTQETLVGDLKLLKNHLNDSSTSLATLQNQLNQVEKQVSQDVKSLKGSLQSMITLLQKGETLGGDKVYVVKPGDSLGKIAIDTHSDLKKIRELNHLSSDRIYVGQKLQLPQ